MGFIKESRNTKGQSIPIFAFGKSRRLPDVMTVGGHKGFETDKYGTKRKRIYAGKFSDEERFDGMNGKKVEKQPTRTFVSRMQKNTVEERPMRKGKPNRVGFHDGQSKYKENGLFGKRNKVEEFSAEGRPMRKGNPNRVGFHDGQSKYKENGLFGKKNVKDVESEEGYSCGKFKIGGKSKSDLVKQLEKNQDKRASDSIRITPRQRIPSKKSILDNDKETEERPKKKKRIIRLDRNDDSNKRLDDGIMANNVKEKDDHSKNSDVQPSKNAQFRAIRPSPSILSYVEDNLLGRRREIEFKRAGYNIELAAPLDNIPFSTSTERERIEETAFRNKLEFFAAAKVSTSFPPPDLPEIAFAGRSNVGKSSLLNSLTRQWGVARTSDKPGLTQTINFFKLGSKLSLVDLPGYGFAYAKDEVKEAWEELVKDYVSTRAGLKRVCLLIDTKWGMRPRDFELIDLMERYQTKYQIVLTKTDLVFPIDVARRAMQIEENLKAKKSAIQPVMMVSSQTGGGVRCLRTALCKIARFLKP